MKAYIKWEHGDADFKTSESHTIKDIHRFLDFIFDLRGWVPNSAYGNLGHFEDGHYQRLSEYVDKINKKYNNEFEDIVISDKSYDQYRPAIDQIWLKDGNKEKFIVWKKCLEENKIVLPKIGDTITITTGQISGYGKTFKMSSKQTVDYNDFTDFGKPKGDGTKYDQYPSINVIVKDIRIDLDSFREYKHDFIAFHYIYLCEHERGLLTTDLYGYDPTFKFNDSSLFYH